jgi:hypothetical protein
MKPLHETPRQRISRLFDTFPVTRRLLKGPRYLIGVVLFLLVIGLVVAAVFLFSETRMPFSDYVEKIMRGV